MAVGSFRHPENGISEKTYLTSAVASAATVLAVRSSKGLSANDYIILGSIGNERTEIVKITTIDTDLQITVGATKFAHDTDSLISFIPYNKIEFASSSSLTGSKTTQGSPVDLEVDQYYNEANLTAVTSGFLYARFYNSTAVEYSAYSPGVPVAGFSEESLRHIIDTARIRSNEPTEDLVSDDDLLDIAKECSDEIEGVRRNWSFTQTESDTQLTAGRSSYFKPDNLAGPESLERVFLTIDNRNLDYYDNQEYWYKMQSIPRTTLTAQITSGSTVLNVVDTGAFATTGTFTIAADTGIIYSGKTNKTFTGVTGISATHTSKSEIFRTSDLDQPTAYSYWNDHILYYPAPDKFYNSHIVYYKSIGRMTDVTKETVVTTPSLYIYYLIGEILRLKGKRTKADFYNRKFSNGLKILVRKDRHKQKLKMKPDLSYMHRANRQEQDLDDWRIHNSS